MKDRRSYGDPCGVARGLDVVGERWALLVVRDLLLGPKRFNDLLSGLPGVSPNVLSQRLQALANQGVVSRRELGPPTRVHLYELTDWGYQLEPVLLQLGHWGSHSPTTPPGAVRIDSLMLSIKARFDPALARRLRGAYELRIGAETFQVEVTASALRIRRGTGDRPEAALSTDVDTFRELCEGRTSADEAIEGGVVYLSGDRSAQKRLVSLVTGTSAIRER